jgi:mRNA-degrading endonuclease HigB of HigAB toxin-antitoxin module
MNAAQKADSFEAVSKIAAVVNLFRCQFPNALADLNPWLENAETAKYDNPNSIDLSFFVAQQNWMCQCRSILMQIQLNRDPLVQVSLALDREFVEVQLSGHDCNGQQWYFSTQEGREFTGMILPMPEMQDTLRDISIQVLKLFRCTQAKQDAYRE